MDRTKIEWTDATWNPVTGCTQVSPGCDGCYALTFAERFRGTPGHYFEQGFDMVMRPDKLDQPLRWATPRMIFVNSMSDLFHKTITDDYIADVFGIMALTGRHTYQLLTKRHDRMRSLLRSGAFADAVAHAAAVRARAWGINVEWASRTTLPLPNLWIGVSVEDQQRADLRIPALLATPAAVRWLSMEPLLGPVDISAHLDRMHYAGHRDFGGAGQGALFRPDINWIVVGGESGTNARPMHPAWARSLRDQCAKASTPYFFKQWGEWGPITEPHDYFKPSPREQLVSTAGELLGEPFAGWKLRDSTSDAEIMRRHGKRTAGRELDGVTWDEYPHAITGGAQ